MYNAQSDSESHGRIGAVLLLLGVGLILASAAIMIHQRALTAPTPPEPAATPSVQADATGESSPIAQPPSVPSRIAMGLFWVSLTVLAFLLATYALVRWSRRFRMLIIRGPLRRTATPDVWHMHRVPEDPASSTQGDAE